MAGAIVPVEPFDLVVFGATGDLARRKLIPGLYHRFRDGQMPAGARVIGAARSEMTAEVFQRLADAALTEFLPADELEAETRQRFLSCLDYVAVDVTGSDGWDALVERLGDGEGRVRAFYLSVSPGLFMAIGERLKRFGLCQRESRIVLEKPIGHDLASARELNGWFASRFDERCLYRIDHYLGKETVQNLMALRFGNALFEPLWNSRYVDHVQITVAESVGVAGRGGYYDASGAMRDMVQNHLLQLLCLIAMEPPSRFEAGAVRDEKLKVLRALAPLTDPNQIVRGQYQDAHGIPSYLDDAELAESRTESFVALKTEVANWRWSGVPFYLRTGKRLRARVSEIAIQFKEPPHSIFPQASYQPTRPNVLAIRLQPDEGITLGMTVKEPGPGGMRLTSADLDMTFAETLNPGRARMPDAYERLLMDVIRGDQTLFMRGDEVEAAWAWVDPVVAAWAESEEPPQPYDPGSSGPDDALGLMHMEGRRWRPISSAG